MYDQLTTEELTVLQNVLYSGTEEAYKVVEVGSDYPDWLEYYRQVHREVGHLFIEAGTELISRLDRCIRAA
jgi:hypothetical protein